MANNNAVSADDKGQEPQIDPTWSVLLDDPLFAVVGKSGNLPCHAGGVYREHTLEAILRRAGWENVHFVNRIDRETSGAVVVAKTPAVAAAMGRDMAGRRFDKRYLCLIEGGWHEDAGLDGWFDAYGWIRPAGDDVVQRYRKFEKAANLGAWLAEQTPQSAHTRFRPIWEKDGKTLLECRPMTGRTAQIRATLHDIGYPVAGDKLYGPDRAIYARMCQDALTLEDRRTLGLPRQALHAWRIFFPHPETHVTVFVEAPPPDFMSPDPIMARIGLQRWWH